MLAPREEVDEAKALALQKLDRWERMTLDIYEAKHVVRPGQVDGDLPINLTRPNDVVGQMRHPDMCQQPVTCGHGERPRFPPRRSRFPLTHYRRPPPLAEKCRPGVRLQRQRDSFWDHNRAARESRPGRVIAEAARVLEDEIIIGSPDVTFAEDDADAFGRVRGTIGGAIDVRGLLFGAHISSNRLR